MDFVIGGLAAVGAGFFTNPLEVLKTRLQLQGELRARGHHVVHYRNVLHAGVVVARTDGLLALQKGLVPALWCQLFLNGLRFGTYQLATSHGFVTDDSGHIVFHRNVVATALGGGAGAFACSPFFLVKTHLQSAAADSIAVGHQHRHCGMVQALRSIYAAHGVRGLWRGAAPTVPRAAVGSTAQLTSFAYCKQWLARRELLVDRPVAACLVSSLVGGVAVSLAMTPFDLVTTRMYNQGVDGRGRGLLYDGVVDCMVKIARTEGALGFYKGLAANYVRLGPHTVLCLVFWEQLKSAFDRYCK